jgi:hypothetical protein
LCETIVELLVSDSDTSRLDNNDLLVNDNFSVVSSRKLLGDFTAAVVTVGVKFVVNDEIPSDKSFTVVVEWGSVAADGSPKLLVVWSNDVFIESEKVQNEKEKLKLKCIPKGID